MTQERLCKNCKYYVYDDEDGGICKRYPPTIIYIGEYLDSERHINREFESKYPNIGKDDWCGEFQDKIAVHTDKEIGKLQDEIETLLSVIDEQHETITQLKGEKE
ncbi:MAG: hypothetical protein ACOCQD_00825 [archaeon]